MFLPFFLWDPSTVPVLIPSQFHSHDKGSPSFFHPISQSRLPRATVLAVYYLWCDLLLISSQLVAITDTISLPLQLLGLLVPYHVHFQSSLFKLSVCLTNRTVQFFAYATFRTFHSPAVFYATRCYLSDGLLYYTLWDI